MAENILTLYSYITPRPISWIWYPYIPAGKITVVQGDPGDGKSTMMIHIISEISKGGILPDGNEYGRPHRVIYQCSEDGAKDTIKPRLEEYGADCKNIAFIDEETHSGLTLDDERIREAIIQFKPWMVVMDPIQSYIESSSDLIMATKARRLMKRIGLWATTYNCAIVLIGHLNKNEGSKGLYRGLGSIDVSAAARSVLQIERSGDIRTVKQIKNNLAPSGVDFKFEIKQDTGFHWLGKDESKKAEETIEVPTFQSLPKNKHELAAYLLKDLLENGIAAASEVKELMQKYDIGEKTMQEVKMTLGIRSVRRMRKWYWVSPDLIDEEVC